MVRGVFPGDWDSQGFADEVWRALSSAIEAADPELKTLGLSAVKVTPFEKTDDDEVWSEGNSSTVHVDITSQVAATRTFGISIQVRIIVESSEVFEGWFWLEKDTGKYLYVDSLEEFETRLAQKAEPADDEDK